jgi:hypothetical protein
LELSRAYINKVVVRVERLGGRLIRRVTDGKMDGKADGTTAERTVNWSDGW